MKGKYIPFLILPLFIFLFISVSPLGIRGQQAPDPETTEIVGEWRDTGECIAIECDSTEGKMEQTWYDWVCEDCPVVEFEAETTIPAHWEDCPEGYIPSKIFRNKCIKVTQKGRVTVIVGYWNRSWVEEKTII